MTSASADGDANDKNSANDSQLYAVAGFLVVVVVVLLAVVVEVGEDRRNT